MVCLSGGSYTINKCLSGGTTAISVEFLLLPFGFLGILTCLAIDNRPLISMCSATGLDSFHIRIIDFMRDGSTGHCKGWWN